MTTETLVHIYKHYGQHKIALLIKGFGEMFPGIENLTCQDNVQIYTLPNYVTLIPSEHKMRVNNEILCATVNTRAKVTKLMLINFPSIARDMPEFEKGTNL